MSSGTSDSSDPMAQYTTRAECEKADGTWSAATSKCSAKDVKGTK